MIGKINRESFAYLGGDFQLRLVAQIIIDSRFGESIIEIIDPNYFEDTTLKLIVLTIKDAYQAHSIIPDMGSLEFRLLDSITDEYTKKYALAQLQLIKNVNLNDSLVVQEKAMLFCKQQELKKSVKEIQTIIDKADDDRYNECEEILKKALQHGEIKDNGINVLDNIDSVLVDDFRKPIATGIKGLDEIMDGGLSKGELGIILAPFGVGKSLSNSSRVYTPNGYTLMGDIKVGDYAISRDGHPTKVLGVYPQGLRDIYKITFNDGTFVMCDKEHLWAVNDINQRNKSSWKNGKRIKLSPDHSFKVIKTSDIIDNLTFGTKKSLRYKIPMVKPVMFNKKDLPINPYVLGVLLGDGNMPSSRVTTKDKQLIDELSKLTNISTTERCREFENGDNLVLRCLDSVTILGVADKLRILGLRNTFSNDKFIPKDYLYNSIENRVLLLQGLMDTDGYCSKSGRVQFTTVSEQLSLDVKELVLSLGGFCSVKTKIPIYKYKGIKKNGKVSYMLTISFPELNTIQVFKLTRKLERVVNRKKYSNNKFIKSITFSHKEEATCIMVDNDEHLFITDDFIVTHNTSMITKIANTAKNLGYNVLQVFFEDNIKVIQRKHLACWSGYDLNDLSLHKEELTQMVEKKKNEVGILKLKKFPSDGTTIPIIKQYIRKLIAQGFRPDLLLIDYIDCIQPSKKVDDVNVGEGNVMRQFETLLSEFDMAGWTAVQGNRESISAEVVQSHQMGGSIKKGQIGHFVVSIAKSLDQKENGTATMAILKSRFGKDGIILPDIIFNNANIQIDMSDGSSARSQSEHKKAQDKEDTKKIADIFIAHQARKALLKAENAEEGDINI